MNYAIFVVLVLVLALPLKVQAAAVGVFTQVEGKVDVLKAGKLPAVPVNLRDAVEKGDVVRTKSQSRAQITFIDETTINIAPGSRVAIEDYMYDEAKGQRNGVLQIFYGMVETVVSKILQTEQPDFTVKTHTAVLGVRGTKWFAVLFPTGTDVYNEVGRLSVRNLFPEIPGEEILNAMEFTQVGFNLAPLRRASFTREQLMMLQQLMIIGVQPQASAAPGKPTGAAGIAPGQLPTPGILSPFLATPTPPAAISIIATPPPVPPPPSPPPR